MPSQLLVLSENVMSFFGYLFKKRISLTADKTNLCEFFREKIKSGLIGEQERSGSLADLADLDPHRYLKK
jgi:hypothetical protein